MKKLLLILITLISLNLSAQDYLVDRIGCVVQITNTLNGVVNDYGQGTELSAYVQSGGTINNTINIVTKTNFRAMEYRGLASEVSVNGTTYTTNEDLINALNEIFTYCSSGGSGGDPQTLSISNDSLSISDGNTIVLPASGGGNVSVVDSLDYLNVSPSIYGVVRNIGGSWSIINDSEHEPSSNFNSVTTLSSAYYNFRLNYNAVSEVGALLAVTDEAYASRGLFVGSSVGLSFTNVAIYKKGISAVINYTGSWNAIVDNDVLPSSGYSISFTAGVVRVTHANAYMKVDAFDVNIQQRYKANNYTVKIGTIGNNYVEFVFLDSSGNLVTTADSSMDFVFSRNGTWLVPNSLLGIAKSNIWFSGNYNR